MAKDASDKIEKITPSPSELIMTSWQEKTPVKCSQPGCSHVAANMSVMNLHKAKIHKIVTCTAKDVIKQYHCPVTSCYYNNSSERFFKNMDILRVHYMKVHSEKNFKCVKCDKGFGLARDCQRHEEECGQTFPCPQCGKVYTKKDSLLRHCDVQKHCRPNFPPKPKPVKKTRVTQAKKANPKIERKKETPVFILPKQSSQLFLPLGSQSVELQTDLTGVQFMNSKSDQTVCQHGHTSFQSLSDNVKSVSVQTASHLQNTLPFSFQCPRDKISMGIQTILLAPPLPPVQSCVAEMQTSEYTGKTSMATSTVPVVKINKSTQKSPNKRQKNQSAIKLSSSSQTNSSVSKKPHLLDNSVLQSGSIKASMTVSPTTSGLWNLNLLTSLDIGKKKSDSESSGPEFASRMEEYLTSMSTQTDFSCLSDQPLPDKNCLSGLPKLHHSHTQTSRQELIECLHGSKNHSIEIPYLGHEEETSQNGQLIDPKSILNKHRATQTSRRNPMNKIVRYSETQTPNFNCESLSSSIPLIYQHTSEFNNDSNFFLDMDQKVANGENMPIDRSRESLRSILLGAIDDSCQTNSHELDLNSINTTPYLVSPITNLDMVNQPESFTVVSTTSSDKYSEDTDLQTINDFAWDTGTQTFDNLMWEMGTQTIEDLVMEMGTQTITTFSSSQMEVGGGLDTATKTPTNLTAVQAVDDLNLLMEAQAMASENWEVAKETVDCQALDTGTQTIMGKSMEMESDCELEVNQNTIDKILTLQKESYSSLNMGTQTADNIIATSSTVNMSWETAVKDLKAQTQKGSNTMVWETGDNTDLEIETKTVGDARWATNFPTVDGLGMDTENQTMADVSSLHAMVFKTGTQTQEDMTTLRTQTLPNMRNLHLDNLDFAVGSQTTSGVTWEKTQTMKGSDLDMGTHTMTSIATLQTLDCLSLHMGPQMSSDLPNIQEGEVISYEMGTQTIANMETLQAVDLGMEIGTQTLEQFIRDSHTQTDQIRNWYDDVVTQTEEDLLEFLTRETHTQTGDDLLEFLTRETQTQNSQFGDERAVQTGDDLLEFFSTATQTQFIEAFNAPASMNHIGVETGDDLLEFLTRETETQTQDNINVSNILSS